MHHTTPIEEQQVKAILKRWRRYTFLWSISVSLSLIIILLLLPIDNKFVWKISHVFLLFVNIAAMPLIFSWTTCRFARRLSQGEISLLEETAEKVTASIPYGAIQSILQAVAPEKELLRASQPNESGDILLRAAAFTDDTPQEQLLRPTQNDAP